ncbi:Fic family protein [Arcobacter sp. YIC-310]|uniref:Fic family protein n=1 Tax=Arcobacter sp. YIC-310 TaxID=3376632 RepID=UPI003C28EE5F
MKKDYPTNEKQWLKYLTIDNYYTVFQIEHRKKIITETGCDFDSILESVNKYRQRNKLPIFNFEEKNFFITDTFKLRKNIDIIKEFWKSLEYNFQSKFSLELLKETLVEEGYYSSTIEGAHSTIKRAKTLAKGKSEPKDKSEFMVFNNFKALIELEDIKDEITNELIFKVHKTTVENTLDDDYNIGEYRTEPNEIINQSGKVIFQPIADIKKMNLMIEELLEFLKDDEFSRPIEKIYKSIAFHFLFAYIHPFDDGNGRTVRILFTYLLKYYGYDMFYYISLSEIINRRKAKDYYQAFIDVERSNMLDKNSFDMTYFFYYLTEVMIEGLRILKHRINTHLREDIVKNLAKTNNIDLTPRQQKIIKILSNKDNTFIITTKELSEKLKVAQRTIQRDLKLLIDFDLIERVKAPKNKKQNYFRINVDL